MVWFIKGKTSPTPPPAAASKPAGVASGAQSFAGDACGSCVDSNSGDQNVHIRCVKTLQGFADAKKLGVKLKTDAELVQLSPQDQVEELGLRADVEAEFRDSLRRAGQHPHP